MTLCGKLSTLIEHATHSTIVLKGATRMRAMSPIKQGVQVQSESDKKPSDTTVCGLQLLVFASGL